MFPLKNTHLITLRNTVKSYSFCMFATLTATFTQQQNILKDSLGESKHQRGGGGAEHYIDL